MGNIIHQNILHFSDSFVVSTRIYGFKIKWILLTKSNKNQGDFSLCFCSVWWANLFSSAGTTGWTVCTWTQASCQTHILTWKPSSEASSPGAFDVFKYFASILLFFPPHTSVSSPLQPHRQHVCDRWGHPDAEGRAHCWRPAGSVHNQPLRALPASKLRWIV